MRRAARIDDTLRRELEAIARSSGCELLHAELAGGTFRLVLDRPEGVSLGDCSTVSREVSAYLDVAEFGSGRYLLEVSSPGLDRPLYRPEDYQRFCGSLAKITFEDSSTGRPRTIVARLAGFDPAQQIVTLTTDQDDNQLQLPLTRIRKARLEIEL